MLARDENKSMSLLILSRFCTWQAFTKRPHSTINDGLKEGKGLGYGLPLELSKRLVKRFIQAQVCVKPWFSTQETISKKH